MAAGAGLDGRLAPCIAGHVLVLAVLGPVVAGRAHVLVGRLLPGRGRRGRAVRRTVRRGRAGG
ncbi:hypothetical protein [Streptomyces sp. NPDC057381]|uniref:hypothetical protein n=1 Tax=Streptomyces sp. NPDC057381 TaxID=3346111 RepID=UPI00363A0F9A